MTIDTAADADLVKGLVAGDRKTFETVFRRHNASMIRVASAILRNHASAEEIVQESWVSVLGNIGSFEGRSSLAGWIFTILTNKARTRAVRDGRSVTLDTGESDDGLDDAFDGRGGWREMPALWDDITPERIVAGRRIMAHVSEAIDALPPPQRAVLVLHGQQGLDMPEVCRILEITEGNGRV
ncbi:MAG: sigma-70 family RNA polymerase sigma factor, partial [Hyphomicrobiales bacterium]|nr:sigma-70 family RNA polymerase sigma factor [Hyphomicrobiales bacterium]